MRIAYIGNFSPEYSTENDVRKAFEYLGHEVVKLQENALTATQVRSTALSSDMLLITSTWEILPLDTMLDIFFECAKKGIPTATIHLDTFWPTQRQGRGWWKNPMFHTAYIFTADGDHEEKWKALGKNHIWLPPAVRFDAAHFGNSRSEYECDVAFVGSNGVGYHEDVWTYRKELLSNLRAMCTRNGWKFRNPGGENAPNWGKINRDEDLNDFYASAKVVVGDSLCVKKEEAHYWSDRVPETLGRGGFLIMPDIEALNDEFATPSHLPIMYDWGNFDQLEEIIRYWLDRPIKRKEYVEALQENVAQHHTYVNRAQTILKKVGLI